jgi:hypothetical protein
MTTGNGAQPRLDVSHGDPELRGRQRAGERAVGIAVNQHDVRSVAYQ